MRKYFLIKIAMLMFISWICVPPCGVLDAAEPFVWDCNEYRFQIEPQRKTDKTAIIPFIAATLGQSPRGEVDLFGVVFKASEADTFWVYEIYDIKADKVIKQISINEMLGITKDKGCVLVERQSFEKKATLITRYRVNVDEYDVILTRIIKLVADKDLPGGSKLVEIFELTNSAGGTLKLRFTERHRNDDYASIENDTTVFTVNKEPAHDGAPILVQSYRPKPVALTAKGIAKRKNFFTMATAIWEAVIVQSSATTNKPHAKIGQITHAVANIPNVDYTLPQARNIASYLQTGKKKPLLAVVVTVDKKEASPGDILTYQLYCFNIGTGKAKNGSIVDPVPKGLRYVPNSATGEGMTITYSIDGGNIYQSHSEVEEQSDLSSLTGEVTHIKWDVIAPIYAGETVEALFQAEMLR